MAHTQIWMSAYQSLGGIPRSAQSEIVFSWMPSLARNKDQRGSFLGASFPGERTARRFSYGRMQVCGAIEDHASLFPGDPFLDHGHEQVCRAFAALRWRQRHSYQVPASLFLGASFPGRGTITKSGYGNVQVCRSFVGVKWWKKSSASNMTDINSAQELIEALTNAGEKLVIVEFFGTWCGTCRALYPKLCQIAEENPDIVFLKVNFELNKKLCSSLDVKVLPLFHFYRGAGGRLDSFSCSLSTVQRLRNAITKHNTDRCSIGPTLGMGDKLLRLPVDNVQVAAAI